MVKGKDYLHPWHIHTSMLYIIKYALYIIFLFYIKRVGILIFVYILYNIIIITSKKKIRVNEKRCWCPCLIFSWPFFIVLVWLKWSSIILHMVVMWKYSILSFYMNFKNVLSKDFFVLFWKDIFFTKRFLYLTINEGHNQGLHKTRFNKNTIKVDKNHH